MAEFPWQKRGDDDKAPRFPWQSPNASRADDDAPGTADEVAAHTADSQPRPASSSMPWQVRRGPSSPESAAAYAKPVSDPQSRKETRAPSPETAARQQADPGHGETAVPEQEAAAPAHGDVPPSTFTPPWRPEEPRQRAQGARPAPSDARTAQPAPASSRAAARAGRIAGLSTLAAVAAVILAGVGAALIAPALNGGGRDDGNDASTPRPTVIPRAAGDIALDAATKLVEAITSGDADAALSMLGRTATSLTTDEEWGAMVEAHPISDVEVSPLGEDTWESQTFTVSYTMNDESIEFTLSIDVDVANPENVIFDLDLPTLDITDGYEGFDITLNGVALDNPGAASYEVFPGAYAVATSTKYFAIESAPVIADSGIAFLYPYDHEPKLTDEGVAKFREVVRASAEACVASTMLDAGCGLDVTGGLEGGGSLIDGTVERTLTDEQWAAIDAMEPEPSAFDGAMIQQGDYVGDVAFYADWQQNGASGRDQIHGGPWLYSPHVDFSDPDLPVAWE